MEPKRYNQFGAPPEEQKPDGPQYARPDSPFIPDPEHPGYFLNMVTGQRITADELSKYVTSTPTQQQPSPEQQYSNYNEARGVAPTAAAGQPAPQVQPPGEEKVSKMPYLPFNIKTPKLPKADTGPVAIGSSLNEKEPLPTKMKIILGAVAALFIITIGLVLTALNSPAERRADTSDVLLTIAHQEEIVRLIDEYADNALDSRLQNDMATSRSVLLSQMSRLRIEAGQIDSAQYKLAQSSVVDADIEPQLQQANRNNEFDETYTATFDLLIQKNRQQVQVLATKSTSSDQLDTLRDIDQHLKNLLSPSALQSLDSSQT